MDGCSAWQFGEDPVEHTIGRPESRDVVAFNARKKDLMPFVDIDMPYQTNESMAFLQETKKPWCRSSSRVAKKLFRRDDDGVICAIF